MKHVFGNRIRRVLIIGDTAPIALDLPKRMAELAALQFKFATDGAAGLRMAATALSSFDAMLVTMHLSDGDGTEICAKLRDLQFRAPIFLLAEQATEQDIICGLDTGADDVIVAPLRVAETIARLSARIRAYETSQDAVLWIDPFDFHPARCILQHRSTNARIRLTVKESAMLDFLYRAGKPVSSDTLLQKVWGYHAHATTHTVATHIYRLRRKIEPVPGKIVLLLNEDGGYRLQVDERTPRMEPDAADAPPTEVRFSQNVPILQDSELLMEQWARAG